jgi:hypothetical protein
MRVPYVPSHSPTPLPLSGGGFVLPRPIVSVRITGPSNDYLTDCLLDPGADWTVFERPVASQIGLDLAQAQVRTVQLVGRKPFSCSYAQVLLRITDGISETYEWPSIVGFVPFALRRPLLGYAGFLQFFDADFHGGDQEVFLTPNRFFPGRRI